VGGDVGLVAGSGLSFGVQGQSLEHQYAAVLRLSVLLGPNKPFVGFVIISFYFLFIIISVR
jgi:hypothetical protein